jgi:plastocyanin
MRRRLLATIATLPLLVILGLAAAGIATAGGGCHGGTGTPSAASSTVVKIDGCVFLPTIDQVPVGSTVTFLNSGTSPHDVTGRQGEWGSPTLEIGASFAHRFTAAGIYPYSCSLHPGMAGMVVVGPIDMELASAVQPTPPATATPAAAVATGSPVPVVAAAGAGLLVGVLGAGLLLRRREQAD